jgi:hypothetical protein
MTMIVASEKLTVDMSYYLDLFKSQTQSNPILVFTELAELQAKILVEYGEYSERGRGLQRDLKQVSATLRTRFARKDQFNELLLEGIKPNAANIKSAIESNEEYVGLKEQIDDIQERKSSLMGLKILIDKCLDMVRAVTQSHNKTFDPDLVQEL